MRSADVYRASNQEPNKFALCQIVGQSTRLLHRAGLPIGLTITEALGGVHRGLIHVIATPEPTPRAEPEANVLFSQVSAV